MRKSDSIKEISASLVKAQSKLENVDKDGTNPHFRSRYATLPNVIDSTRQVLAEFGLAIVQTADLIDGGQSILETTLIHTSGEWISGMMPVLNPKGDMQGLGSAWTYARRYGLMAILGIAADDDDAEQTSGRTQQAHQQRSSAQAPKQEIQTVTHVAQPGPKAKAGPKAAASAADKAGRDRVNEELIGLYQPFIDACPDVRFIDLLTRRYGVKETKLMTIPQCEDLARYLREQIEIARATSKELGRVMADERSTA